MVDLYDDLGDFWLILLVFVPSRNKNVFEEKFSKLIKSQPDMENNDSTTE